MQHLPTQFEDRDIRRVCDEQTETWWSSVVDIVQVLTQQPDYQTARKYWNKLKESTSDKLSPPESYRSYGVSALHCKRSTYATSTRPV